MTEHNILVRSPGSDIDVNFDVAVVVHQDDGQLPSTSSQLPNTNLRERLTEHDTGPDVEAMDKYG